MKLVKLLTNAFHVVLGIITAMLTLDIYIHYKLLGITTMITYITYQSLTSKSLEEVREDLLEYVLGLTTTTTAYIVRVIIFNQLFKAF